MLAMPSTLAPHRPMLAAASAPRGLDAPWRGWDTLSEASPRSVTSPQYLVGYG
jgi:hypothetical protein